MVAQNRNANPAHRPDKALADLYAIMEDKSVELRIRIDSAISASRVEPLGLLGETPPPAVAFLRKVVDWVGNNGKRMPPERRRQAGAALAYWERRAKQAQLKYVVADPTERREAWRRILNGCLRRHLWAHNRWPADKKLLFASVEDFEMPRHDPELALAALLLPPSRERRRRSRSVDEPIHAFVASETERVEILRDVAQAMEQRLKSTGKAA